MTEPADAQPLYDRLTALTPGGFEVFVCDAIAELLGTRIRKSRAGHQGGRDGAAASGLMVECKRYIASQLSDRELIGELHEANSSGCDVWVLAATTEVSEQTASKLEAAAQKLGMIVIALDWPSGQAKPLQALAWAAPKATHRHLDLSVKSSTTPKVERDQAIDRIKKDLDTPFLSIERLRRGLSDRLDESLRTPGGLRGLGARPAAAAPEGDPWSGFVERRQVARALTEWWQVDLAKRSTPAILLGDEGVGKSLAALDWLRGQWRWGVLVIPISSSVAITTDDPFELLADACRRKFGDTTERWRNRLVCFFSRAKDAKIRTLVYLDGINEQPDAPWASLLRAFQAEPFLGSVSVLMSCRPWPYAYRFSAIAALDHPPKEIKVGLFDDEELAAALGRHGRRLSDFPEDMRKLLSRPRLLAMALRNEAALRAAGEYTVARLFWEDWRDRVMAGRQIVNAVQYRHALVHLAKALDRRKTARALTAEHGTLSEALARAQVGPFRADLAEQSFSEIVDGGLARLDQDLRLRLDPVFAALALGLELRRLLVDRHDAGQMEHLLLKDVAKMALEPWGGADFGASVARFAAWAAAELEETPTSVRSAILAVWLDEQNYAATHREDAMAIVRRDAWPAFVVAEDVWMDEPGKAALALQRAFEPSLAPDHEGGAVRAEMIARVRKWAGWISLDRKVTGMTAKPRSVQRESALEAFKIGAMADFELEADFELCGERLKVVADRSGDGDAAATFGLDTLVASGSADLAPIAITAAVAGVLDLPEDLAMACIRMLRRLEPGEQKLRLDLLEAIDRLKALREPQAIEAADNLTFLLDLFGEPIDASPHPLTPVFWHGASPIYREHLPDIHFINKLDEHILREALLEPDAHLFPAILEAVREEGFKWTGENKQLDFRVVREGAAVARGLHQEPQIVARRAPDRPPKALSKAVPLTDIAEIQALLDEALFNNHEEAFERLALTPENIWFSYNHPLLTEQGYEISKGEQAAFTRDRRALSGRWLVEAFSNQPAALEALASRLLDPFSDAMANSLKVRPGLAFGVIQAAFLQGLDDASKLWSAATANSQDYMILPDRRLWYFDLPFEAADSPAINRLRNVALAAADSEDRLLDLCIGVRRWKREAWMDAAITADLGSGAAWRIGRAVILQAMMGQDPSPPRPLDPKLAPSWLSELKVAAFRYKRREERMKAWIQILLDADSEQHIYGAVRVLTEDGDRRLSLLTDTIRTSPDRRAWLDEAVGYIEDADSHQDGGGLLQYFLGIHRHPWLGPPGLPDSPFS